MTNRYFEEEKREKKKKVYQWPDSNGHALHYEKDDIVAYLTTW